MISDVRPASASICNVDRTVNLVDERIDLAVRTSNDPGPELIANARDQRKVTSGDIHHTAFSRVH
nr:putative integron gene cassette protein [uncultured bacterium]